MDLKCPRCQKWKGKFNLVRFISRPGRALGEGAKQRLGLLCTECVAALRRQFSNED